MKQPNNEPKNDVMKKEEPRRRFFDVSVEVVTEPMSQEVLVAYPTLCSGTNTCIAVPLLEA